MLKRITLWIVILIFPTTLWFAFTDDGNQAFQIWFGYSAGNLQPGPAEVVELTPPDQPEIIYMPVQSPEAKVQPYLQVQIAGRNNQSRKVPAGVLVVDAKGRRTGYDPVADQFYDEIPHGQYDVTDMERVSPPRQLAHVTINPAQRQEYRIEVIGIEESLYDFYVERHPWTGSQYFRTGQMEMIRPGELHSYTVNLQDDIKGRFLGERHTEPVASWTDDEKKPALAITSHDTQYDVDLPSVRFEQDGSAEWLIHVDEEQGYSFEYPAEAKVNKEWQGLSVLTSDSSVILKVIPDPKSHQKYQYNQARTPLQAFTAAVVPHIVGIAADGPDGGLHPVGIMGSNEFTNRNGVKGLQTYVIHEVHSFSGEDTPPDISYEAQGPVYVIPLMPEKMISPVLVIAPFSTNNRGAGQDAGSIADSIKLLP